MEAGDNSDTLKAPLSFSMMQNNQFVFLQVNLDAKEFNEAQAEPELIVVPSALGNQEEDKEAVTAEEATPTSEAAVTEEPAEGDVAEGTSGRRLDFYAAPYMLKLMLEQDLIPV